MTERSTVAQVSQIGVEATPGTAVPATRRLGSLSVVPSVNLTTDTFRPAGLKFPTISVPNQEYADVAVTGKPTFEEVIYPLAGAFGTPVITQVMDGATQTGAYEWQFDINDSAPDTPETFTLENGDPTQAEQYTNLLFTGFGLDVSRASADLSGAGIARAAVLNHALTGGLALPAALTVIAPGMFSAYMADTPAALDDGSGGSAAANLLGRLISANPSVSDKYVPAWFVNAAESSFGATVENANGVGGEFGLTVEANDAGMGYLTDARNGDTKFVRLEAVGPTIYTGATTLKHLFRWDMAVKVINPDAFSDSDGIYAIPWHFAPVHDGGWGKAHSVLVRNTVQAL